MNTNKAMAKSPLAALTPEQVEGALRHILVSTLALYALKNARRPISAVIHELMDMECKASQLVGAVLQLQANGVGKTDLNGTLAGIFSFIPPVRSPKNFTDRNDESHDQQGSGKNHASRRSKQSTRPAFTSSQRQSAGKPARKRGPKNQL